MATDPVSLRRVPDKTRLQGRAWVWWIALALVELALLLPSRGAEPLRRPRMVLTTNYVVVTNVVVVTNYLEALDPVPTPPAPAGHTSPSPVPAVDWVPPEDRFDWIQLKSGEWLKGRLKAMQNRELEFESEELDDLTFDWEDIRQVRSARALDVLFTDGEQRSGPITIKPGQVGVGAGEPRAATHKDVQSLTPAGSRERDYWSGKGSMGLTLRAGNTEEIEYNAQAHIQRRTTTTRLSVDYIGNASSSSGVETANNHRVNSEFDLWLSRRFYLIVPFAEYYKDPFQNLSHRLTVGGGIGYQLIDRSKLEWAITTGPGFQKAWFESSPQGENESKGVAALVFGSRFDWHITRLVELILEYRGQYTSRAVGETTHHSVSTLSLDLTKRLDLDISFVWDRITFPKMGADGIVPKPDDFRLVIGMGLDF